MHTTLQKLNLVKNKVNEIISQKQLKTNPQIIVVTKTFPLNKITHLLESGQIHFGENKVQEAEDKWIQVKTRFKDAKLHMIGTLQTNKVKKALQIFDFFHSLDRESLAKEFSKHPELISDKFFFSVKSSIIEILKLVFLKSNFEILKLQL